LAADVMNLVSFPHPDGLVIVGIVAPLVTRSKYSVLSTKKMEAVQSLPDRDSWSRSWQRKMAGPRDGR
jgi:hypothetical protein